MDARSRLGRTLGAAVGVAALAVTATACDPAPQSQPSISTQSPTVAHALALLNGYRASNGLGPLIEASDAAGKAQMQANAMAAAGGIYHSDLASGIQPGWRTIAENVGYGRSVDEVQAQLQASAPHRANMLSSSYNQIGIGVAVGPNGLTYVAQEFVGR
jgi:uncharacterized protein YkwD